MRAEWDESYFEAQPEDAVVYWVCFWTGDDIERSAQHDPHRVTGVESVEEVIAWVHAEKGERYFELFVETDGNAETREHGWMPYRKLIRLAGDFTPGGTTVTFTAMRPD
jgi:hypothetical protein